MAAYGFLYAQCLIRQNEKNWVSNIKDVLSQLGRIAFSSPTATRCIFTNVFSSFESSNKCFLYKHIVDYIIVQNYFKNLYEVDM